MGILGVQGDFMEPSRWELKIPLRVLCILSDDIERMGLPDLRAKRKTRCISNQSRPVSDAIYHPRKYRPPVHENLIKHRHSQHKVSTLSNAEVEKHVRRGTAPPNYLLS